MKANRIAIPPPRTSALEDEAKNSEDILFVGEKVECPCRGRGMYNGKIVKDNKDGTYAVLFDEIGEEDDKVPENAMRKIGNLAASLNAPSIVGFSSG